MSAHCWMGLTEWLEGEGVEPYSDEWLRRMLAIEELRGEGSSYTCMLEDGHEGPHEWTNDSDIFLTLRPDEGIDVEVSHD